MAATETAMTTVTVASTSSVGKIDVAEGSGDSVDCCIAVGVGVGEAVAV